MITRSNRSKGMTKPDLQGEQTALSRSKVLDQHKLISNPITRGCNDSLYFLLQVFLLSCHSPPSTQVSTVSVRHGFIIYFTVILAWSILHIHIPHYILVHLHILLSRLSTLAQLNPFTCLLLEPNSWRNSSDLKTAAMARFSFKTHSPTCILQHNRRKTTFY